MSSRVDGQPLGPQRRVAWRGRESGLHRRQETRRAGPRWTSSACRAKVEAGWGHKSQARARRDVLQLQGCIPARGASQGPPRLASTRLYGPCCRGRYTTSCTVGTVHVYKFALKMADSNSHQRPWTAPLRLRTLHRPSIDPSTPSTSRAPAPWTSRPTSSAKRLILASMASLSHLMRMVGYVDASNIIMAVAPRLSNTDPPGDCIPSHPWHHPRRALRAV